ncbi:hypothetical protein GGX14DRAFT_405079 [Mycena pura]|uniref:MYND-type domain-containing protein n=1 Tax=Mycena pura TaxID=153505 RepID=A0AAD6UW98_9AGAR|nr:hypothetical protein GGX14DRAFT_405079 [Mycena pura]
MPIELDGRRIPFVTIKANQEELEAFGEKNGVDVDPNPGWSAQKAKRPEKVDLCQQCAKPPPDGTDLKKCSQCQSVFYCSKECQREDWKCHKKACKPSDSITTPSDQKRLAKLVQALLRKTGLVNRVALLLAIKFDDDFTLGPDKEWVCSWAGQPRMVRIRCEVVPADMGVSMQMAMGGFKPSEKPVEGMLQLYNIMPYPETYPRAKDPTPIKCFSSMFGEYETPLSFEELRQMMNNDIRMDQGNQLKLRINMNKAEVDELIGRGIEVEDEIDFENDAQKKHTYTIFNYQVQEQIAHSL